MSDEYPYNGRLSRWEEVSPGLAIVGVEALEAPFAFWIVCPKSSAELPKISTFRNWLLGEAEQDQRRLRELKSGAT